MPDSEIDYSDIPPLSDEQLAQFRRAPKVLVSARLDRDVYDWLKNHGEGDSTRINNLLRAVMSRARWPGGRALPAGTSAKTAVAAPSLALAMSAGSLFARVAEAPADGAAVTQYPRD